MAHRTFCSTSWYALWPYESRFLFVFKSLLRFDSTDAFALRRHREGDCVDTLFITMAQQCPPNFQWLIYSDFFLVRDFVMSASIRIWQKFCVSSMFSACCHKPRFSCLPPDVSDICQRGCVNILTGYHTILSLLEWLTYVRKLPFVQACEPQCRWQALNIAFKCPLSL
jgi:hypothetical protein